MFMFFSAATVLSGLALARFASAQSVHDIAVGSAEGSLTYTPSFISASIGDQVVFHFHQKNHTATQSSFADPCHELAGGFDSGFMPVSANQNDNFPTFTIPVNDTKPIWVYCRQAENTPESHCGNGMVFAVNPGANGTATSFANYLDNALAEGAQFKAAASSASAIATSAASGSWTTAAYGSVTIPAEPTPIVVTETITVEASSWTTVYSSYIGSPEPTPVSLSGTVHNVIVGGSDGQLTYSPSYITAEPRDVVVFEFHQKNHTATQSSFSDPCRILTNNTTNKIIGLDSGFMPVAANATEFPTFNVTVNDTAPIWFYCKQHTPSGASHCGEGMVFAVNAVADSPRNFSAFQALAKELNGSSVSSSSSASPPSPSATDGGSSSSASARFNTNLVLGLGLAGAILAALL